MSTRNPSDTVQCQIKTKKVKLKDLVPKSRAGQLVKGGPISHPDAGVKGRKR